MRDIARIIAKGLLDSNKELAEAIANEIYESRDEELKEKMYNDWRLPTIEELITLIDFSAHNPASLDKSMQSGGHWSSTTHKGYDGFSCSVYFYDGDVNYSHKSNGNYVRCVREGYNCLEWSADSPKKMNWYEAVRYAENLVAKVSFRRKLKETK